MPESLDLTRALHSISVSKAYLENVRIEFPGMARRVDGWINKLSFISHDALSCLTPQGREVYRRELVMGDPLQFEHLFILLSEMTPEQRSLMEKAAESLLKGELIITE